MAAAPASCMSTENGCVMFDCLIHLWEWLDPPATQSQFQMENKKAIPATHQPLTQQHLMAQHVHPEQIYSQHHPQLTTTLTASQTGQIQPNGVMHQLLQSQYQSKMNARSPLLENRHELYGTGHNQDYARHYGANDNYNYPQSPPRFERPEIHTDHNVNQELHIPKGYNAEVYQDYLKRNPPKETNQIYQNHQPMYRPNVNQYGSKPYLPYSNRIGPQSNTELLRRQYNEIQQMKLQQQMHYQNQAQMHQQQKFAERQLLLQQIHGVQPPPNLQNSIYSDGSYRDLDRYSSKNDFKDYSSPENDDSYSKNDYNDIDKQNREYQETQWQTNQQPDYREQEHRRQLEGDKSKSLSPPSDYNNQSQKNNMSIASPMKSSDSGTPSVRSPSSDSRRSSSGNQALRSPIAQRIPSAPITISGILYKQGSDGLKVWRKRWFVLSEYCLFYYKSQEEEKLLGSVLLPSYKVSACRAEDKVLRKFSFKLEHANMRTYILAAPDQEAMIKWVKALTMAALMQSPNEQPQRTERTAAKTEDGDDIPTYANAPPKPRRSNDGYNSPSPEMYDPNYDLLKKPASHYSQGTPHTRYQDHANYPSSPNQEPTYSHQPQSPPTTGQQQPQYQTKRTYDAHHLSLPLTNSANDRHETSQHGTASIYTSNPQSPYIDRTRKQQQPIAQEIQQEQIYDRQSQRNLYLQDSNSEAIPKENDIQSKKSRLAEHERLQQIPNEAYSDRNTKQNIDQNYNREVYGETNTRPSRSGSVINERLVDRQTPDAYGRSTSMSSYNKGKMGDYEDVYGTYDAGHEYGKTYVKSPNSNKTQEPATVSNHQQQQEYPANYPQEKTFSGPSVLRRKKMQASGIQPPMPRPHSADFLEYESKNEMQNNVKATRAALDPSRQPQRPKSSLDINSYYDPSSDRYYSEESYAEKMRQSAQYLQQGLTPRNIQAPLAKYASGLAEKQLSSAYSQIANNNYEAEFVKRASRDNISCNSKYADNEALNSNWTLKEKGIENQKDYLNRSGSVMSDGSNVSGYLKDMSRFDQNADGFIRSASARLPSSSNEKDGEKKVQQREESMKRLLEWKQRMLQSPLTRKSTPATISLARSLNHSRQSLRSDQYKPKTYTNASYNSYSSDDEEETSGTDLQKPRDMQAGRSRNVVPSPIIMRPITPHAPYVASQDDSQNKSEEKSIEGGENTYENILCTISIPTVNIITNEDPDYVSTSMDRNEDVELNDSDDDYETHESEAESESHIEYTDNDLDEVLMASDAESQSCQQENNTSSVLMLEDDSQTQVENPQAQVEIFDENSETPVRTGENHYLPMSPRKTSTIDAAHATILQSLSIFDQTILQSYEDNPYVEMNIGNEEEDMQTYEVVCVNNGKIEPVYMELTGLNDNDHNDDESSSKTKPVSDTASNFADTKEQTLKRASKGERVMKETSDCSDADDEIGKDSSLDNPFSRFSISDTFRPASYYLSSSRHVLDAQDCSDTEISPPPPIPSSSPPCEELSDDALSKYILDKLDKSDMTYDNSILKMLTSENQKMNTVKRKTTSLMIYGSRTSIHDTLSRGEKIRNSRASLINDRNKMNESSQSNLLSNSFLETYNTSSAETDSLGSYNADRGSSRLSLQSDVSSKFEIAPSNLSSEVTSLNESEIGIDLRHTGGYTDNEMLMKRRPLSDDSIFELIHCDEAAHTETTNNIDLDRYLDNLQPSTSHINSSSDHRVSQLNAYATATSTCKDNLARDVQNPVHVRCSSTPVNNKMNNFAGKSGLGMQFKNIGEQMSGYTGSQSSCGSLNVSKSPISYYCKDYDEEKTLSKNLNNEILADKIKEFENEKLALRANETNASSISTGFHSRESSTEHSAPYYYSDLSSQEHIDILPTSHYLKNTNLHRKLNNQRRRGPSLKKSEISHIHNPIRGNQLLTTDRSFELVASARSVSVEFLSATVKDPDIDLKNIYESTSTRSSKIPESMNLSGLGCKRNSSNNSNTQNCSLDSTVMNASTMIKLSSASMSSHCSGNSSTTVYYDAEADASAYENVIAHGEKHWDEDSVWRDNLRRVSHRHARSMDDLDSMPADTSIPGRITADGCGINSIKRVKKDSKKLNRNVTYVNCDLQGGLLRGRDGSLNFHNPAIVLEEEHKGDDNDVYVSLAEDAECSIENPDEGVYEQLTIESNNHDSVTGTVSNCSSTVQNKKKFEIDREKLRQWDLMSSGLMKCGAGRVRGVGAGVGGVQVAGSTDLGTDNASSEASMTMSGTNIEPGTNINQTNQQALSKKAFLGSNTSIGRNSRDANIPVRAVSPRVRWVEDKPSNEMYNLQQMSTSQQNLNALSTNEESWAATRSPSRASQQPISAVSPRVRRNTENDDTQIQQANVNAQLGDIPTAGELLGRTHEELVLLLIQLRRRHAATHRAIQHCCSQITSIEDCLSSLKAMEREENLQRLEQLKIQLMELEHQYEKSKPLVQLVDNMVKLGSLYNRPESTLERLERNQRLRQKVLAEHALEQQRWLESVAAGKPLETEAARARVAELWALEQELADEASILQGLKTDKDTIESMLTGVRGKLDSVRQGNILEGGTNISRGPNTNHQQAPPPSGGLEAELARVHAMLAHNSKKLEQTVADNARLERELQALRRALHARRAAPQAHAPHPSHPTAMLEDEVSRVQQLVYALQRQRQELSRAVRHLTNQSQALQTTHDSMPGKRRPISFWQETNLDTGHTIDHGHSDYEYHMPAQLASVPRGHYEPTNVETPLYVDTRGNAVDVTSPLNSEDLQHNGFANLSNVEKQEIKTVRIVKRESERRQRDRERSLQPMSDWPANNMTANLDQFLEEELVPPLNYTRAGSLPRTDYNKYDEYYAKHEPPNYLRLNDKSLDHSPKFPSSPSLSNYDYSRDISSLSSSYHKSYDKSGYDRTISISTQYLNSPTDSSRTLTNDISKTSSIVSLTRSNVELSPIFKSEAAKQIITEMSNEGPRNGSLHRRQVPKEKRRHYTAPHHLSAKTLNEMPKDAYNQDKLGRSLDDADMERALRGAPAPDVVRSALPPQTHRLADNTIDQLLAAPQKILIPERYIPEKPPELSPEEQQKRMEKVESIKKMLSNTSADQTKSPEGDEKRQREHLLQMNQILAKQVTEMSKIIAVKALEELPQNINGDDLDDRSPDVELPIYQQRDNFFT